MLSCAWRAFRMEAVNRISPKAFVGHARRGTAAPFRAGSTVLVSIRFCRHVGARATSLSVYVLGSTYCLSFCAKNELTLLNTSEMI